MGNSFWAGRTKAVGAALIAGMFLLGACSSADGAADSAGRAGISGPIGAQPAAGDPQDGGVLTFAVFSLPATLDPAKTVPSGSTGGTEMAAVYDLLMRYDNETGAVLPQLAKSLQGSDDGKTWTMTLRDGVTFSNGAPLDAAAVVWSIERFVKNKGSDSQLWATSVARTTATSANTVVFELNAPWATFPMMLAAGPGMIVAKQADAAEAFQPIGAGPFTVAAHKPNEEIKLSRRADYWDGAANLDGLRFIPATDAKQAFDMFRAGEIQMSFVADAQVAAEVVEGGYPGHLSVLNAGSVVVVNNAEGRPGSDLRVREAIAKALDPVVIDERAQAGLGRPSSALFSSISQWQTGAADSRYNPDEARALLAAAKADGYDGKISFVARQAPEAQSRALAIQAMLNDVGFEMTINSLNSVTDLIRVMNVERDYDIGQNGFNIRESAPFLKLYSVFHSKSTGNISGYANPQMDELLAQLQAAASDEAALAVIGEIETLYAETVPAVSFSAIDNMVIWQENVYGAKPSFADIMLLGDAWIA